MNDVGQRLPPHTITAFCGVMMMHTKALRSRYHAAVLIDTLTSVLISISTSPAVWEASLLSSQVLAIHFGIRVNELFFLYSASLSF